jgi:predicted nucleic acid-binding protein
MTATEIVPDSSFYYCFVDDVNRPDVLVTLLTYTSFHYVTGPVIDSEVRGCRRFGNIEQAFEANVESFAYYQYGEIIRPLFALDEIKKGEHEVVVISYIFHHQGATYKSIIDEAPTRTFLQRSYPELSRNMNGTIGFLEHCTIDCKLISKGDCITLLEEIKESRFRIEDRIVDEAIERLRRDDDDLTGD